MEKLNHPADMYKKILFLLLLIISFLNFNCSKNVQNNYNVVIVSIDALRFDHMGFYGYYRDTTPRIDSFFKKGTSFMNAITPRPKTTPSMASMLTGLYPYRHGVRNLNQPLSDEVITLPEVLKKYGYKTSAFISNYVLISQLSGLNQGFDVYDDYLSERTLNRKVYERKASNNVRPALEWLKKNSREKFFMWIHFMDPHGPLTPPPPYNTVFKNPKKNEIEMNLIPKYQRMGGSRDINHYIDLYDGEIKFMDFNVGKLFDEIKKLGISDKTVIIFTADHGESLGEHNYYLEHGNYVYDACSRIPLCIFLPNGTGKNKVINSQVSLIDVFPTILDLLGIKNYYSSDGESLLPLISGNNEHTLYEFIEKLDTLKAVRTGKWKLIYKLDKKRNVINRELYNLINDKNESKNLIGQFPKIEKELGKKLQSWINLEPNKTDLYKNYIKKKNRIYAPKIRKLTEEDKSNLKSLGYIK